MEGSFDEWLREATEAAHEAVARRDELTFDASEAGMTRRAVAAAVGFSPARVQQIVKAERRKREVGR